MGAHFAVALAQRVGLAILYRSDFQDSVVTHDSPPLLTGSEGKQVHYVDDLNSVGIDRLGVNQASAKIVSVLHQFCLPDDQTNGK